MKEIKISTQQELDALKTVQKDEYVIIESSSSLKLNANIEIFGRVKIDVRFDFSYSKFIARGNSSVEAWENSSVEARGNSSVEAWENSSVEARGNSSVEARGNSSVEARGNSSVEARGNSSVVAWGNSSVVAWENSSVEAWENSSVEARGNSSVVARENSSVVAWENSCIRAMFSTCVKISLFGFSVLFKPKDLSFSIEKKSKTCIIQEIEPTPFLEREGVDSESGKVILFKKVSAYFMTQEGTSNETVWTPKTTLIHANWKPTSGECGEGKFHACSRPYFCDEFRNSNRDDRYIAIEIETADLYEWTNPEYPHKIAFRKGTVLYECDKFGKEIKA